VEGVKKEEPAVLGGAGSCFRNFFSGGLLRKRIFEGRDKRKKLKKRDKQNMANKEDKLRTCGGWEED